MTGRVVHLWQYRMRRERDLARRMRMQERKAALDLGYTTPRQNVSREIWGSWSPDMAPVIVSPADGGAYGEFLPGDWSPEDAA